MHYHLEIYFPRKPRNIRKAVDKAVEPYFLFSFVNGVGNDIDISDDLKRRVKNKPQPQNGFFGIDGYMIQDVTPVKDFLDEQDCYMLVIADSKHDIVQIFQVDFEEALTDYLDNATGKKAGKKKKSKEKVEFDGVVKKKLLELGISKGWLVTVDCHE